MKWSAVLAASSMVCASSMVSAKEPEFDLVLSPSGDWVLDYAEERCSLMRKFGEGDDVVHFQIDSFGRHYDFRVLLAGKSIPIGKLPRGELRYRLTAEEGFQDEQPTLEGKSGDLNAVSYTTSFGPDIDVELIEDTSPEELTALTQRYRAELPGYHERITTIDYRLRRGKMIRLETGPMGPPFEALNTCVDDLQKHWGFDPDQQRALQRVPMPKQATIRNIQRRYPSDMILDGVSAYVPVRMTIDAEGKPTNCVVQVESVDEAFKRSVCEGMARGFDPALDKDGNPVAALYSISVVYLIR